MGVGPVDAIPKILEKYGLQKEDIDLWEVRCNPTNLDRADTRQDQ